MEEINIEVYRSLNKFRVKYILIGGLACILYGSPRITKDTDIFIEAKLENCKRLLEALKAVNFGTAYLTTPEKILENEVTRFRDYVHLDVLTRVKGIDFQKSYKKRVMKRIQKVSIPLLHINDLILSKKQTGRDIDLGDIKILIEIKKLKGIR